MAGDSSTSKRPQMAAGQRYGRLTAIKIFNRAVAARWQFRCDCGKTHVAASNAVRRGTTASCGCLQRERHAAAMKTSRGRTTHGMSKTSEYITWRNMRERCCNPKRDDYSLYGGRGIKVCQRWLNSFESFLADMGPRPPKHSLDRYPNKSGNYAPDNCRWATAREQRINQRSSRLLMVKYRARKMTLSEACVLSGASYSKAWQRLKRGWPLARALAP